MSADKAIVFDIQRGSMVDGPGVRTTVFFKGCPLRCAWCHNPEALTLEAQTCISKSGKTKTYGETLGFKELWSQIEKDRLFFEKTGGGLTLSGGEPMLQFEFVLELAKKAKKVGIHTALDTTGFGKKEQWQKILPQIDLVLLDYKHSDSELHRKWTGVSGASLDLNFEFILNSGVKVRLRCPIVPGVNNTNEHFEAIGKMARRTRNLELIEILPYHDMGKYKYAELGLDYKLGNSTVSAEDRLDWESSLQKYCGELPLKIPG
ncbi:MAG: glycyl-radical enzyme activating protein [Planctomycetes bacterium]|nr:glycyl-radical enzyme activating protein [Planctomycetota bacterium]